MDNDNIMSNTNTSTQLASWDATNLQLQLAMLSVQIGRWRQQLHTLLRATARELHYNK